MKIKPIIAYALVDTTINGEIEYQDLFIKKVYAEAKRERLSEKGKYVCLIKVKVTPINKPIIRLSNP